jgi:hypothetical protein
MIETMDRIASYECTHEHCSLARGHRSQDSLIQTHSFNMATVTVSEWRKFEKLTFPFAKEIVKMTSYGCVQSVSIIKIHLFVVVTEIIALNFENRKKHASIP